MLNTAASPPAGDQVTINARYPGGAVVPGTAAANFTVQLSTVSLASTKRAAVRQPIGTLVKLNNDYYVMGLNPIATTASDLTAWNALADDGAVAILTLHVIVNGPEGVAAEYSGLGFDARHPRYASLVLGPTPPVTADLSKESDCSATRRQRRRVQAPHSPVRHHDGRRRAAPPRSPTARSV